MDIQNRTILITGGGSGLGAATVRLFAVERRANVIIADLNEQVGRSLAEELGAGVRFIRTDVVNPEEMQAAVDLALNEFGDLHGLVNCAGIGTAGLVVNREGRPHDLGSFARTIAVNLTGTFNAIRLATVAMMKNNATGDGERGVIVNTASVAAYDGQIGQAAYSASKGGIVGMTLPIAREVARHGIRVMAIAPGLMDTPLLHGLPTRAVEALESQIPFPPRLGRASEYAALVGHIFENPYLNGEVIRLDGAVRMPPR
jgi:NAD(P)-dependent dehydrogenase (short-subunit alcohol dehydrogenase family)